MSHTHCAVQGCKMNMFNKPIGVYFHPCPASSDMRNKWLHALRNKCATLDWTKSRICSKHFENKYFDSQRKLKDNAIPTLFATQRKLKDNAIPTLFANINKIQKIDYTSKDRIDKALHKLTQAELVTDINKSLLKLKEPAMFDRMVSDELKCRSDAPVEVQQWLLIKKQNHLNTRLLELVAQDKRHAEVLQKNMEDTKKNLDTYKYIIKCLQEKVAHHEEQIEILTAVESR